MFLSDNTPMRRMALRAGMSVQTADGESHAERDLLPASVQEFTHWFLEEGLAHSGYFSTLGMAQWRSLAGCSPSIAPKPLRVPAPAV